MLSPLSDIQSPQPNFDQYAHNYQSAYTVLWKRLFDIIISILVTIVVFIWVLPLISLLIKLSSPGPVIFVQWRMGRNGKPFQCLKFRTMVYNRKSEPFKQTVFNDPRITPIGQWLRKTNLDELPQFLNVIIGDMSIVGPRPHALQHDAEFWSALPDYYKRYAVLPGITGLAQICGARGITDNQKKMEYRLQYDLSYIEKSSLLYDVRICWWTVKLMFYGDPNAW